ncbi:hypothetical protein ACMYR3_00495 [Ampullimonas aquatilis]|uniref:hypothetical protein n=1 Tax=Ampullimonas aquatilis TaxID=1341549 RepID=UPI003C764051
MARKGLQSRQKNTFRLESVKPRNPLATLVKQRVAGRHGPDETAQRRIANQQLKKLLQADLPDNLSDKEGE